MLRVMPIPKCPLDDINLVRILGVRQRPRKTRFMAHYDSGFLTFLLQVSPIPVSKSRTSGEWIDASPIPGTLVINIGRALELVISGPARATSHSVCTPPFGSTPRYAVAFSHTFTLRARLTDEALDCTIPSALILPEKYSTPRISFTVSPDVLALKAQRGDSAVMDFLAVNYAEYGSKVSGKMMLVGCVKSHPDIAERYCLDLFKEYFPAGLPKHANV